LHALLLDLNDLSQTQATNDIQFALNHRH